MTKRRNGVNIIVRARLKNKNGKNVSRELTKFNTCASCVCKICLQSFVGPQLSKSFEIRRFKSVSMVC